MGASVDMSALGSQNMSGYGGASGMPNNHVAYVSLGIVAFFVGKHIGAN